MPDNDRFHIQGDMVFKLSHKRSPSEVKLRSLEWAIVTQLNGEKTVDQISEILALSPEEAQAMFGRLMAEGLLELVRVPETNTFVPPEVFNEIEQRYTYYVGPVANILIEDLLAEMKRNRQNLERKQLPLLVELLGLEISSPEKRLEFQKFMLQKIKELV
ncbi:MAG: hypothetical protein D6681_10445 [Calditrichaeota bacterium]|nr:MAG: hypothetical protein D6681_10445 [Calditrichota bacterium]